MPTDTIPAHYSTEFSTNWMMRAQQMKARFDAFIVDENFTGERKRYDRLFKQESQERTERKAPTPVTDPGNDSRWCYRRTFDLANTLAEEDARNLGPLVLPTSDYVASHAAGYHRDCDRIAYGAAIGTVMTGEAGTTPSALGSGQKIVAGGTGLTLAKLLTAVEILNGADLSDEANSRIIVVAPQQITNLLNTTEVKSADYNTVKALAAGTIDTFMGFKFVISNLLTKASTTRTCAAWCKGAIKRVKGAMRTSIDRLPQQSNSTQIFSSWDLSAARVYDEGVVQIDCTET
jgi:hypothetical protein